MPLHLPPSRKRTTLYRLYSQPVRRCIETINPILRGWVHDFAVGHASRCFADVRRWVEKKGRRHLAAARQRRGFSWKRWRSRWLYDTLELFDE
jgi:RNA-directed DNA polymerase